MKRRAFSLPEVMLVIFVLMIVFGLFIVWVDRTRERDRSSLGSQTRNNLKQCALAVHNFHDTYRKFPPAFSDGGQYVGQGNAKSLWFHLLPYVEADNVYKLAKEDAIVPAYNAPSDPFNADQTGALNFAANLRIFAYQSLKTVHEPVDEPGMPLTLPLGNLVGGLTMGRLTAMDGTSNIIMLSTRYSVCGELRTRYATNVEGSNLAMANAAGGFMGIGSHTAPPSRKGTPDDMFQIMPRQSACQPAPGVFGHSFSEHGMSTALADGSVKHISVTMSPQTFTRALCPNDKQQLGRDWEED